MTYLKDGKYLVIPDLQVPYHDVRAVNAVAGWVADNSTEFQGGLCVGDEGDLEEVSRWAKGLAGEYAGTFEANLTATHDTMKLFDDALNNNSTETKMIHVARSNHGHTRYDNYTKKYAPALNGTSFNDYAKVLGYNGHGSLLDGREGHTLNVKHHIKMYNFAKDWVLAHGDEGPMSKIPGRTAMQLGIQIGSSVVCGHTHKAGLQHQTYAHTGKVQQTLIGMEAGHMMDLSKASYLKTGGANWQQAFGILTIEQGVVYPTLIPIINKSFVALGQHIKWK